jgi:hypothetical protein
MPVIPVLGGRLMKIMSSRPAWATYVAIVCLKKKKKKTNTVCYHLYVKSETVEFIEESKRVTGVRGE